MRRVLTAVAHHEPEVGYVQGMNFIVAGLLYSLAGVGKIRPTDEKMAFLFMLSILKKYEVEKLYTKDMKEIMKITASLETFIELKEPAIHKALNSIDSPTFIFFSSMLFSICLHVIRIELAPRILDLFFLFGTDGLVKTFFCMIQMNKNAIIEAKGEQALMDVLQKKVMPGMFNDPKRFDELMNYLIRVLNYEKIIYISRYA